MTAIVLAVLSAVANFFFIPYYPFWSILVIALAVWVIWALTRPGVLEQTDEAFMDKRMGEPIRRPEALVLGVLLSPCRPRAVARAIPGGRGGADTEVEWERRLVHAA